MSNEVLPLTSLDVPTFTLSRALRRLPAESATATKLAQILLEAEQSPSGFDLIPTASVSADFLEEIWELLPSARSLDARLADEIAVLIDKPLLSL